MTLTATLLVLIAIPGFLLAQEAAPLLVNVDWLAAHSQDRDVVVLAVEPKAEYAASHIPGARHMTMEDVSRPANRGNPKELILELPAPDRLRATLAALGISDNSRIVVTYGSGISFTLATRVIFALDSVGLGAQTSLLNGGTPAWSSAGKPLTTTIPTFTPGKLTARAIKPVVADAALVASLGEHAGYKLVDGRSPAAFRGVDTMMGMSGHIHGALNIPYNEIVSDKLTIDRDHVATLFRAAGIQPGDTVVAYCYVGQVGTAVVFGARLLGNPVMLYDGSLQDWAMNNRGALEK